MARCLVRNAHPTKTFTPVGCAPRITLHDMRKIIHIDMDAFFASIEQQDHPEYRGKPLIVGGSPQGRGVVAACSYEARRFGIHSAMPCAQAVRLCPRAIFARPRMARYLEVSAAVMTIFADYTDLLEPLSVDEAFLDVTVNLRGQPSATLLAKEICQRIVAELGLSASAGVSYNKFLAKVASAIKKPGGITTVTPDQAGDFLAGLPVRKFYGVGEVTEQKMLRMGIATGADLRQWSRDALVQHFGKGGIFLYDIVRGIDPRPVEPHRVRKSIGTETTFAEDILSFAEVSTILDSLADKLAESLATKACGGHTLTLKIRYHDFTTITRSQTVRQPILCQDDIRALLPMLLGNTQAGSRKVRLLGLTVSKLCSPPYQLRLPFALVSAG